MSVLHNPIACARLNVIVLFDYLWMRSWPLMRPHSNLVVKVRKSIYARERSSNWWEIATFIFRCAR